MGGGVVDYVMEAEDEKMLMNVWPQGQNKKKKISVKRYFCRT